MRSGDHRSVESAPSMTELTADESTKVVTGKPLIRKEPLETPGEREPAAGELPIGMLQRKQERGGVSHR
jgi:hypothetical protein